MRAQVQPLRQFHENAAHQFEDLGWNDMGHDTQVLEPVAQHEAEIVVLNPASEAPAATMPEVLRQQEAISERVARAAAGPRRSALSQGRRAAFTLRLDAERHLKLRLACVLNGRSAQQLVTEALDRLIADMPELAELAARAGKRG
jgi:hypothetical protein